MVKPVNVPSYFASAGLVAETMNVPPEFKPWPPGTTIFATFEAFLLHAEFGTETTPLSSEVRFTVRELLIVTGVFVIVVVVIEEMSWPTPELFRDTGRVSTSAVTDLVTDASTGERARELRL